MLFASSTGPSRSGSWPTTSRVDPGVPAPGTNAVAGARPDPSSSPRRPGLAAALTVSMAVGPLAVYSLTALSPLVVADLGLTTTQFGSFATLAFVVAAVLSGVAGSAVDRFGTRPIVLMLFATAGVALVVLAVAQSYLWLLVAVAISGAAQSLSNPVTNQLIAEQLPTGRRGAVTGLKQGGVQLSQLFAGLALPAIAVFANWRAAIASATALAVLGMLYVLRYVPRAPANHTGPRAAPHPTLRTDLAFLLAYTFLVGASLQVSNVHLPIFAHREVGFGAETAGLTAAVIGAVGLAARSWWGWLFERIARPQLLLLVLALAALAGVGLLPAAAAADAGWLVWAAAVVHGGSAIAANVIVMLAAVRLAGDSVGKITGVLAVGQFLGFAVGPVAFGALVDATGNYLVGWLAAGTSYGLAAAVMCGWAVSTRRRRIHRSTGTNHHQQGM